MKFIVRLRSSPYDKPCDGLIKGSYNYIDRRYTTKPENVKAHQGKSDRWFAQGTNHRLINGHIERDIKIKGWLLDVNSLEDLIEFKQRAGHPIIIWNFQSDILMIEIDDYSNDPIGSEHE